MTDNNKSGSERTIPEGKVWKFTFGVSHAPHYVIQHDNGAFSGIYAPVENVPHDVGVPFGLKRERVLQTKAKEHVTVTEVDRENSPWADGVFLRYQDTDR